MITSIPVCSVHVVWWKYMKILDQDLISSFCSMCECWGITQSIPNFSTKWHQMAGFQPGHFTPWEIAQYYPCQQDSQWAPGQKVQSREKL
jgi:hypothetical protein